MMRVIYISYVFALKTRVYFDVDFAYKLLNYFQILSRLCKKVLQIANYCMLIVCYVDDLFRQGTLFAVL